MIDVRLFAHLVPSTGGKTGGRTEPDRTELHLEARPGLTVRDAIAHAGVRPEDVHIIMLNGVYADIDAPLSDGDRLGLFPAVSGG